MKRLGFIAILLLLIGTIWGQASLPFAYDAGKPTATLGLTHTGLGTDYSSSPKMKFDTTEDNLILFFTGTPDVLTFNIKWNKNTSEPRFPGNFELLESSNGIDYTTVQLYNSTTGTALPNGTVITETFTTLNPSTRYIKWLYTAKSNGNIAIGAISLTGISSSPSIIVLPNTLSSFSYGEGSGPSSEQSFMVSGMNLTENISITAPESYEISLTSGSDFTNSLNIPQLDGTVESTPVYVRLKSGLLTATYNSESIDLISAGAPSNAVICNGLVTSIPSENLFTGTDNNGWMTYSVSSNKNWTLGSDYFSINAYGGDVASEDYLISPVYNLDAYSNENISFNSVTQYTDITNPRVEFLYTDNYTGNPATTIWTPLTATWPESTSILSEVTNSGIISLTGVHGNNIRFAFKYTSSGTGSGTSSLWRIDDVILAGDPFTLPVELSSFNASFNVSNFVSINWTTQSEENMLGYYIHRNETDDLSSAIRINNEVISAHNQPTAQNYTHKDVELEKNTTYYYWLQSADLDGTTEFFGPVTVKTGSTTPDTPIIGLTTNLKKAYPNPFNPSTTISFDLVESSFVNIEVFNLKGQLVKTLVNRQVEAGNQSVVWNGLDNNSKPCTSGVYFYRMSAGKYQSTQKIIMMK